MSVKNMDDQKKKVALVALDYINYKDIVGVGTGSTVNFFIEKLKLLKGKIDSAVASSLETEKRLKAIGLNVIPLNEVDKIPIAAANIKIAPDSYNSKTGSKSFL